MTFPVFKGNCPRNVSEDAKYHVRDVSARTKNAIVSLVYESEDGERWYPSTYEHPELVEMVNAVKTEMGEGPGGPFYINEYKQVIVPVKDSNSSEYYLAGIYEPLLEFDFEGKVISGKTEDLDGNPISPGDKWAGSHHGIPYILCAGGKEIEYRFSPRPKVEIRKSLGDAVGREQAKEVAKMVAAVKGPEGGRFYVNEYLNVFAPLTEKDTDVDYIYCGGIDLDNWFPMPHAE